jgi:hypothetical protein
VQFLEALANLCIAAAQAGQTTLQLPLPPPEVLQSSAAAIRALMGQLSRDPKGGANGSEHSDQAASSLHGTSPTQQR